MAPTPGPSLIPIFPLDGVVLFPGVDCPLFIFEPRYRQMTRVALAGERRIGMVSVIPEHSKDMAGDPPVFSVGCAGTIRAARELPDGRFQIVLCGTTRFRIMSEPKRPTEQLYRSALVTWLKEDAEPSDAQRMRELRKQVIDQLRALADQTSPARAHELVTDKFDGLLDAAFVNGLCQVLTFPTREKLGLLQKNRLEDRLRGLVDLLEFRLAELSASGTPGSPTVH